MIRTQECREKATDLSSEYEISKAAVFAGLSTKKKTFHFEETLPECCYGYFLKQTEI